MAAKKKKLQKSRVVTEKNRHGKNSRCKKMFFKGKMETKMQLL
jgi:hypothetical protein